MRYLYPIFIPFVPNFSYLWILDWDVLNYLNPRILGKSECTK